MKEYAYYLSFESYKQIQKDNGRTIKFDFNACMEYFDFCIKHDFMYYGFYSKEPIEALYYKLKCIQA